jgi:phage shock protein PspC (stress-responsive transcriptional regulator)
MVTGSGGAQAGCMTETPPQTPPGPPPPPQEPPAAPPTGWNTENLKDYRRLRRSRHDRKVAGVAGGLGRHLDVDPTILRVLFVVLVFFGGAGLLLYGAMWLFVPEEETEETVVRTSDSTRNAILITVAVVAGLLAIGDSWNGYGFPWPLAVAALVLVVVLLTRDGSAKAPAAPPGTPGVPPPFVPGGPAAAAPSAGAPAAVYPPPATPYSPYAQPADAMPTDVLPTQDPAWYPSTRSGKTGPVLFGPTVALVALALGLLGLYDATGGSVPDAAYPALALAVIGAMLVLGAFVGRPGGLTFLGIVAAIALPLTAIGGPSFEGDRNLAVAPTSAAAVADSYEVPAGRIELDLTGVRDLEELDGREIAVDASAGEIVVVVPDDLRVDFQADVEFGGAIDTPDGRRDGWGASLPGVVNDDADTQVDLDLDLRFGHIELRQS